MKDYNFIEVTRRYIERAGMPDGTGNIYSYYLCDEGIKLRGRGNISVGSGKPRDISKFLRKLKELKKSKL